MLFIRSIENARLIETRCETLPAPESAPKGVWYDLLDPTPEERAFVDAAAGVSIPSRAELEEIEVSSRLYSDEGVEYMTVTAASRLDSDAPVKTPVLFVLNGTALVTARFIELRPFVNAIERMSRPGAAANVSAESLMLTLIEAMVDRLADALEQVGSAIDESSRSIFRSNGGGDVGKRDRDLQATIERVARPSGAEIKVDLSTGEELTSDQVMMCIGREPNTQGLGLEKAGVEVGPFGEVLVVPGLMTAATDSKHMAGVADAIYRFSPFRAGPQDLGRFHGNNERMAISNYVEMVHFYHRLLSNLGP